MSKLGILAYGSLINDPGVELKNAEVRRKNVKTPFPVEFAWYSGRTRGGAPTLAPVRSGGSFVKAKVLVLKEHISVEEATNRLWRRETGNVGTGRPYPARRTPRAVRIRSLKNFAGVETVLYTDFYAKGKIRKPKAQNLASSAIKSVVKAKHGKDGITYLKSRRDEGIRTALMHEYEKAILKKTGASSLDDALRKIRKEDT
jgi:hypothetical protein